MDLAEVVGGEEGDGEGLAMCLSSHAVAHHGGTLASAMIGRR